MSWQPSTTQAVAARRAVILQRLRQYFEHESVMAVDTPALSFCAVSDLHIESLAVTSGLSKNPLYLQTSPEFCMKRLLAAGYPDIYSIARVFRDGEVGRQHQPEFTLAEWYRLNFDLDAIIADTVAAIVAALGNTRVGGALDTHTMSVDYADVFADVCQLNIQHATLTELTDAAGADAALRDTLGESRDAWLDLLLATKVTASFRQDALTVIKHFPISQAALARACPDNPDVADRFEVFLGSIELANGYVELTDAQIQLQRIRKDQAAREAQGLPQRPHDRSLLAALETGLPACAGVALGVERLHMVHDNVDDIRKVISFAFESSD